MDRRAFIQTCIGGLAAATLTPVKARGAGRRVEARWYEKLPDGRTACGLCPHGCVLASGHTGQCRARTNRGGTLYSDVYGLPVSTAMDPIEKKPLFHFMPGTRTFSLSTAGCNFRCRFCQNWELSQHGPEQLNARYGFVTPLQLVNMALRRKAQSMAFTYGEPVIFSEYMLDAAQLARTKAKLPSVMISNGYIEKTPLDQLCNTLAAIKVDFKAYDDAFFRNYCGGTLKPVLDTMQHIKKRGVWLEIVHLTIPTLNDKPSQLTNLCKWVRDHVGPDVPVHFTRFHPTYKLTNLPPTPPSTLERAWHIAHQVGLHYPYVGNLPGHEGEHTRCHHCGHIVIRRVGFRVIENRLKDGHCSNCKKPIPGMWG